MFCLLRQQKLAELIPCSLRMGLFYIIEQFYTVNVAFLLMSPKESSFQKWFSRYTE